MPRLPGCRHRPMCPSTAHPGGLRTSRTRPASADPRPGRVGAIAGREGGEAPAAGRPDSAAPVFHEGGDSAAGQAVVDRVGRERPSRIRLTRAPCCSPGLWPNPTQTLPSLAPSRAGMKSPEGPAHRQNPTARTGSRRTGRGRPHSSQPQEALPILRHGHDVAAGQAILGRPGGQGVAVAGFERVGGSNRGRRIRVQAPAQGR